LRRVFAGLATPTAGTDDEIQLRELKQQYLNFILVILNNDLGSVLVSPSNQGIFDDFIATATRFAIDPSDPQSARLAFSTITRLSSIWGGPDIAIGTADIPNPSLPGFDNFMLSQFAPLPWSLLSAPGFNAGDAQLRSVIQEAAALQWTILRKVGFQYQKQLEGELDNLGVNADASRRFFENIAGDVIGFRKFYGGFVQGKK
jgi:exportin-T